MINPVTVFIETDGQVPKRMTAMSAGYDIVSNQATFDLEPGQRKLVSTGIRVRIENGDGFEFQIRSRSGVANKHGVIVLNSPGTIDADYTGEIRVILANLGSDTYTVNHGDRIAQLVLSRIYPIEFIRSIINDETDRGSGGFGSTGQ